MANILFTWELGGGQGHLVPHRSLLERLSAAGHDIHVASRDLLRAGRAFSGIPVHYWQTPLSFHSPSPAYQPTISMAHVLHNVGFALAADVELRLTAWRNMLAAVRPAVMIADYSPTALLAARGSKVATIAVGIGFCLPPNERPLPAFETLKLSATPDQLAADEGRVVETINQALRQRRIPKIESLSDIFHTAQQQWLTTVPELDHYPRRGAAEYLGLSAERPGQPVNWPDGNRRRVFGYLKPFQELNTLLELLNKLELPSIIACDGLSPELRSRHTSPTMTFVPPAVDLNQMARECHFAITNGNHTTTARFLLAGKPVLMAPLHLEQELIAHAVQQQGLGVAIRPHERMDVYSKFSDLLNSTTLHVAAEAFADRSKPIQESRLDRMVDAVQRLVNSSKTESEQEPAALVTNIG